MVGGKGDDQKTGSQEIKEAWPGDIHIQQHFLKQRKECIFPLQSILVKRCLNSCFLVHSFFSAVSIKIMQSSAINMVELGKLINSHF